MSEVLTVPDPDPSLFVVPKVMLNSLLMLAEWGPGL